ncbi:MAG TPA: ABC transporter substrate-binding protein [Candidatus Binatia bacterium]|nr:ABC transporter substrate-binding protein [Candidatus Binatia bacterium]
MTGSKCSALIAQHSVLTLALGAWLFALSGPAEAQQPRKVPRVGLLLSASIAETAPWINAFRHGLRELGYVEGKNIILEIRRGDAKPDQVSDLAAELVNLEVDVIVAAGNPAVHAAMKATTRIPIVIRTATDPVKAGYVASLARPGGNITGVTSINLALSGKRLELVQETVPGVKRVAVLTTASNFTATGQYKEMEATARVLGSKLQILKALDPDTIDSAFVAMTKERAQVVVVTPHARYLQHGERILKQAAKYRLPAIYFHSLLVENGGLMSYGANVTDEFRRAAIYVDKILKGAKPADLPVEQPRKFELVINLKTAEQIGLTIPPNVLARADRIIR